MPRPSLLIATLLTAAFASGAGEAHPKLLATSPAANATVAAPKVVSLHFSEKLVAAFSGIDLAKLPAATKISGVASSVGGDGKTLMAKLAAPLAPGRYRLSWHAVSVDTHRVKGDYAFTVK